MKLETIDWETGCAKIGVKANKTSMRLAMESARAYLERGSLEHEAVWWSKPLPKVKTTAAAKATTKSTKMSAKESAKRARALEKTKQDTGNGAKRQARNIDSASEVSTPTSKTVAINSELVAWPAPPVAFTTMAERREFCPPLAVLSMGKPPPYERLHRSVFVSVPPPTKLHKSETITCECRPPPGISSSCATTDSLTVESGKKNSMSRVGCGSECLNRKLRFCCDARTCPCGESCSNRPLSQLAQPKTKITRTENRGWGLFLLEDVKAGTFIVEYAGEIVNEAECAHRLWQDKQSGEENFYLMEISTNYVIDAKFKGSIARFINSSCHPNCETQRWVDASSNETRVGIFATEDIPSGTELTYDYNFAHFGDESGTSFQCMCGHPKCRGTLDAAKTNKMHEHIDRRIRVQILSTKKGQKRKMLKLTGVVVSYDRMRQKHKIKVDDADEFVFAKLDGDNAAPHVWLKQKKK